MSYYVKATDITLTGGNPVYWERSADSGNRVSCAFCPRCGSRLWHCDPEIRLLVGKAPGAAEEAYVSVKGGSLDTPVDFAKAVHIWTASKIPGMEIPEDAAQFPGEPPADEYP
ncbi:MAG: GFA family protein [Rhodospirillales bacterium]